MNERILRGSDLADWYLTDSACRPLKGVEPARGIAPNRCNANLRRTDVPQQGPMLGLVGRRWAAADEGQAPSGESIQLQQRANKQEIGDSQGAEPLGGFLVPFCPYKKVPQGTGLRKPRQLSPYSPFSSSFTRSSVLWNTCATAWANPWYPSARDCASTGGNSPLYSSSAFA